MPLAQLRVNSSFLDADQDFHRYWQIIFFAAILFGTSSSRAFADTEDPMIAYDIYGHGPEKVIVLHSWIDDASSFDAVKPYWDTDTFTFVFVELRGYGRSKHIKGKYTAKEAAADTIRVADSLGWQSFHVIGHSMSGMIVQRLAVDDWKRQIMRLKSVIAVTPVTANGYPADEATTKFLYDLIHHPEMSEQMVAGLTGGRLLASWNKSVTRKYIAGNTPEAMRGYYKMWLHNDFSAEAAAAKVETPMLVIAGMQDFPGFQADYYQKTFSQWYPNVQIVPVTDAGHFPMYETPVYFATLVENFLKQHSAKPALQ